MSKILVTGSAGFLGKKVVKSLLELNFSIIGVDLKKNNISHPNYEEEIIDIRKLKINEKLSSIIHLASVMNPPKGMSDGEIESIEIDGINNLISIFKNYGQNKFIFTSSGAAYGYTKRNLKPLKETDEVIGNIYFPYSKHKAESEIIIRREVEAKNRVILRPGTILGSGMRGPIHDYFKKKIIYGVTNYQSPFCFIHTDDVVEAINQSIIKSNLYGTFNLSGDGFLSLAECCDLLRRKHIKLPKVALKTGIHLLKKFKLTRYHPYQVDFMCYRPVLNNDKFKKNFCGLPSKTSKEVFTEFCLQELTIEE